MKEKNKMKKLIKSVLVTSVLSLGLVGSTSSVRASTYITQATHHIDMVYVTPMRVTIETTIGYYNADSGNRYITVWLKTINRNDVQKAISDSDFKLYSQDGAGYDVSGYAEVLPELVPNSDRLLEVNGHAYGSIGFEVPSNMHHFSLRWSPSPDSSDERWPTATWVISV